MAAKKAVKKTAKKTAKKKAPPIAAAPSATAIGCAPTAGVGSRELNKAEKTKILNALRNELGDRLTTADEASAPYLVRRPTGIIDLDVHLGGGFPAGGPSMLGGPFNSGKSWLLWRMIAEQQRIYGDDFMGAIANVETAIPYDQAIAAGCRIAVPDDIINQWAEINRQRHEPDFTSEQIDYFKTQVGVLELINGDTGEDILNNVLKLNEKNIFSIIGVDSVSALLPAADADKDLTDEQKRGAHASMMKKFWLAYVPQMRSGRNYTTLVLTMQAVANQERASAASFMQKYIKQWDVKGGEASKHYSLINLLMWSGDKIKHDKVAIGKYLKYETRKGKAGTHDNIVGDFPFYYQIGGVDLHGELISSAMRRGILVHYGGKLQLLDGTNKNPVDGICATDETSLRQRMQESFDFELAIRREVLISAGVSCLYR